MKDIVELLRKEGKSYKEISEITGLSKSTISYHIGEKKDRIEKKPCPNCGKPIVNSKGHCSKKCWLENISNNRIKKLNEGNLSTNPTIRKALAERDGNVCSKCKIPPIWNGESLTLHVDHIDGDSDNNSSINLRLLCPNCHSQLETSKNKGKKNSRRNNYLRRYKGYDTSLV